MAVTRGDGYCTVVGRIKDMIIRGGENVYPREVEEFLHTHPDIDDVQVIGVPDDRYGEEICAWIEMRPGTAALDSHTVREFSTGKLAHYKIPSYVRIVDTFPMTVTGKVRKLNACGGGATAGFMNPSVRDEGRLAADASAAVTAGGRDVHATPLTAGRARRA